MPDFNWGKEAVDEAGLQPHNHLAAEPETLALSADDFSALEERVSRAVSIVRRERQARAEAQERAGLAEAQVREQATLVESMQKELNAMRAERDQVRQRVDRLLAQLNMLEL
jgi:ubiquinone biosynthesis protein UbiJ